MIIPEGLMHRKINLWMSLLIIFIVAAAFAYAISVQARNGWQGGGRIFYYQPVCTQALPTPTCPGTICPCGSCGCVTAPCVPPAPKWEEIDYAPARGSTTGYVCPPVTFGYKGSPIPRAGQNMLGYGLNVFAPITIGLSR